MATASAPKAGAELPYLSTERAARDMDRIRGALGDKRLADEARAEVGG